MKAANRIFVILTHWVLGFCLFIIACIGTGPSSHVAKNAPHLFKSIGNTADTMMFLVVAGFLIPYFLFNLTSLILASCDKARAYRWMAIIGLVNCGVLLFQGWWVTMALLLVNAAWSLILTIQFFKNHYANQS